MGGFTKGATSGGGGTGTVTSVTAADTSVVIGGTPTVAPTVRTNTLDVIAVDHPPVAAVPMNAQKITGLANGTVATDAAAFGQIPTIAYKSSDQSQNTNTVLTSDTALLFAVSNSATEVWLFELFCIYVAANTTMDFKTGFTIPAAATMLWSPVQAGTNTWWLQPGTSASPSALLAAAGTAGSGGANVNAAMLFIGMVFCGGTSGNVNFQWAQNTSDAGTLTVKAGSILRATKVQA